MTEEITYLEHTLSFIRAQIEIESTRSEKRKNELVNFRREMLENGSFQSDDIDSIIELTQQHVLHQQQMIQAGTSEVALDRLQKALEKPYFARVDFQEDGEETEKLYIGLHSLIDDDTCDILVYDWRSPIAGIFYDFGIERAHYKSPEGTIHGEIFLKRHFHIEKGKLLAVTDSGGGSMDDHLLDALSRNTTGEMRQIVETIQAEQNRIIRDMSTDVLLVEGVAGSGKTVVALHRIAYLLYRDSKRTLNASDMVFLSPNPLFTSYTQNVLPELGEEAIQQPTYLDVVEQALPNGYGLSPGGLAYGELSPDDEDGLSLKRALGELLSPDVLNQWVGHYVRNHIQYEDMGYCGTTLLHRNDVKNTLLNGSIKRPFIQRASRLAERLVKQMSALRSERMKTFKKLVIAGENHPFDHKAFVRMISIKEQRRFRMHVESMLTVCPAKVLAALLAEDTFLGKHDPSEHLKTPAVQGSLRKAVRMIENGAIPEWATSAVAYIHLLLSADVQQSNVRHVVIDEAQDYNRLDYHLLKGLFPSARFTILGDGNQQLLRSAVHPFEQIQEVFSGSALKKMTLHTSYRTASEITHVADRLIGMAEKSTAIARSSSVPRLYESSPKQAVQTVVDLIEKHQMSGYSMTAVITKTTRQAGQVYQALKQHAKAHLATSQSPRLETGVTVLPVHLAKGLEFDSVIVYDASARNYPGDQDLNKLYVACTRPLHRLDFVSIGPISPLLSDCELEVVYANEHTS